MFKLIPLRVEFRRNSSFGTKCQIPMGEGRKAAAAINEYLRNN